MSKMPEIASEDVENNDKTENNPGCMSNFCAGILNFFSCLLTDIVPQTFQFSALTLNT